MIRRPSRSTRTYPLFPYTTPVLSGLQPIVEDASRDLTPLPRTGAVSQEVALAIGAALLCLLKTDTFLAGREPAGEELGPGMAGIDDGFELRGGEQAFRDGALRKLGHIARNRRRDRSHRHRFHERSRMLAGRFDHDTARPVGQIDADLIAQGCGRLERGVADRQELCADRLMRVSGGRPRALDRATPGQE